MKKNTTLNICQTIALFLVLIIDAMGIGIVFPLMGPIFIGHSSTILSPETSHIMRDFWYSITLASFCVFMFFGAPFMGDLSDHIGRKKVLLICLFGTALGYGFSAIGIVEKSLFFIIFGRSLAGFMCGSQALAQAAIVDMSTEENKTNNLSLISLASCIGFALGPFLGGIFTSDAFIAKFSFIMPFVVAGILALLNGIILLFSFNETFFPKAVQRLHITKGAQVFISAFTNKVIRKLAIVYLLAELGWAIYFQFIPLYAIKKFDYHTTSIAHFMTFMGILFGVTLLWIIRILTKHLASRQIANMAFLLNAFGIYVVLFGNEWSLWLGGIPAAIGGALFYVALLTVFSNAVNKNSQGWVMGVFAAIGAFSWGLGGVFSGALDLVGMYIPFIIAGSLLVLSYLIMITLVARSKTNLQDY